MQNPTLNSCFAFSICLSFPNFLSVYTPISESALTYLWHYCANATLSTPNSTYQSNLNTLLSSLSSTAANSTNGFADDTAGQNPLNRAYRLFLCCGDLNTAMCSDCVATGKRGILQRCPNRQVSVIWYDLCMLRYANRYIFSPMERSPNLTWYNHGSVANATRLMEVLLETTRDVTKRASDAGSGKKVAEEEVDFTSSQKLYAFVERTPNLSKWECNTCLQFGNGLLVQGKQGGSVHTPSCNVRYKFYPFYNVSPCRHQHPRPCQHQR